MTCIKGHSANWHPDPIVTCYNGSWLGGECLPDPCFTDPPFDNVDEAASLCENTLQLQNVPTAIGSTHHANHLHVLRIRQSLISTTLNRSAKIQSTVKNVLWYVKRVISDLQ